MIRRFLVRSEVVAPMSPVFGAMLSGGWREGGRMTFDLRSVEKRSAVARNWSHILKIASAQKNSIISLVIIPLVLSAWVGGKDEARGCREALKPDE